MISEKQNVGRFSVEIAIANNVDLIKAKEGLLKPAQVRRSKLQGVVDCGAARVVLPKTLAQELGLEIMGKVKVRYADGRTAQREAVENVYIEVLGRHGVFIATLEPKRTTPLIGAIVLEELDLLVDCLHQRLYPRDPRFIISEIE